MNFWQPGTPIAMRGIAHDRVWMAHAVRVVEHTSDWLAVYLQPGAECKIPGGLIGRKYSGSNNHGSRWDEQDGRVWSLMDWNWQHRSALIVMRPDKYYAVYKFWLAETGAFEGWYVNFQVPYRTTATSVDTLDLEIDMVIAPDLTWQWKDEAEYDRGVKRGSITPTQAKEVSAAREEILELVQSGAPLLAQPWPEWRPNPEWTAPALPVDWQLVSHHS